MQPHVLSGDKNLHKLNVLMTLTITPIPPP
jgi:hypothetical protein